MSRVNHPQSLREKIKEDFIKSDMWKKIEDKVENSKIIDILLK